MTAEARRPTVLFVCVHNAGRSQMAAALLEKHATGRVQVISAGSAPADAINPAVIEVMRESGIDLTARTPKLLTPEAVQASDVVIMMGCGDACPGFPVSATWTGRSRTPPGGQPTPSDPSATTLPIASKPCSPSCYLPPAKCLTGRRGEASTRDGDHLLRAPLRGGWNGRLKLTAK